MTWELRLPWATPPITANQRNHWRKQAALVAEVRGFVYRATSDSGSSPYDVEHVTVGLHYWPRDRRRRDADNLVPTLKAACDGLVDADVVEDDTPAFMAKLMPEIHAPDGDPRLVLIVEVTQ